jgi:hypothetical protein
MSSVATRHKKRPAISICSPKIVGTEVKKMAGNISSFWLNWSFYSEFENPELLKI